MILGAVANFLPAIQAALVAGQETIGESGTDTAAVEVDDVLALVQREDDALVKSIRALHVQQAGLSQQIEGITACREMSAQAPAGSITDLKFPDQSGILQPAPVQIAHRFWVAIELLMIESRGLYKHSRRVRLSDSLSIQISQALAEGQMAGQMDKPNQIAALAAAVVIENIFASVHAERGPRLLVLRTKSDDLGAARRMTSPVLLPQIVQQRQPPLESFDVFSHSALFASGTQRRQVTPEAPGKDGGEQDCFLQPQRPEDFESGTHPGQRPGLVKNLTTARQPMSDVGDDLATKGRLWLGEIGTARPAANRGRIRQTIGIPKLRQRLLPRTLLCDALSQCLTAGQQAVLSVRKREQRKESERLTAPSAAAPSNPDPIVMLVVRLLAATPVVNDRIPFADRASAYDDLVRTFRPLGGKLIQRREDWEKEDHRRKGASHTDLDLTRPQPAEKRLLLKENPTEKEYCLLPPHPIAWFSRLASCLTVITNSPQPRDGCS